MVKIKGVIPDLIDNKEYIQINKFRKKIFIQSFWHNNILV